MKNEETYRVYELRTTVTIHPSMPEYEDSVLLRDIVREVHNLSTGAITIVSVRLPDEGSS